MEEALVRRVRLGKINQQRSRDSTSLSFCRFLKGEIFWVGVCDERKVTLRDDASVVGDQKINDSEGQVK